MTRRTLFGIVAGFVALRAAVAEQKQKPPKPQTGGKSGTANPAPGLLAQSRLAPDVVARMTGATLFSAQRRVELSADTPNGAAKTSGTVPSRRFPLVMDHLSSSTPDQVQMASRLAGLLLRDEVWTGESSLGFMWRTNPFQPDFTFTFADIFPGIIVSVCPRAHEIRMDWTNGVASRTSYLLLDPIGKEMTAFIKDAFPGDTIAQALTFTPTPAVPLQVPKRPPQISPVVWAKIQALRPGMTRADVLQVFEEEGGISTRLHRSYILRKNTGQPPHVKIRVQFAPADYPLLWRSGKGFLRNVDDIPRAASGDEMPSDIITALSPLYLGYFTMD